jgi:transposase
MAVMIGVDPHKGSHTAVAIDAAEVPLGEIRVRAGAAQAGKLVEWAAEWPERIWAVEGAGGLGHVLAQQLVAAGEYVLDVQPKLGARVRLLSSGTSNKNDPNDARSVAVAALRSPACHPVRADDHAVVLRVWSRRHRQLSRLRTQAACWLHAVLCELTPGGIPKVITAAKAAAILDAHRPAGPVDAAWHDLAAEHLADLRRLDAQLRETRATITAAVKASGASLTEVFGVGPVIAAAVIGDVADVSRFPSADRFASYNGTAPIEASSGSRKIYRLSMRGNRRLNHAIHMAAVTQIAHKHSQGHAYYQRKLAEGKTPAEARRALKRKISNAIYARLQADARVAAAGPGGQPGNGSASSAASSHPENRLFGPATPGPRGQPTPARAPGRKDAAHAGGTRGDRPQRRFAPARRPRPGPRSRASGQGSDQAMTSSTPDARTPLRNDDRNDTAARCPACGQPFTPSGRRRWRSDACRQAAWRRRHPAPGPAAAAGLPPPRRPPAKAPSTSAQNATSATSASSTAMTAQRSAAASDPAAPVQTATSPSQ